MVNVAACRAQLKLGQVKSESRLTKGQVKLAMQYFQCEVIYKGIRSQEKWLL